MQSAKDAKLADAEHPRTNVIPQCVMGLGGGSDRFLGVREAVKGVEHLMCAEDDDSELPAPVTAVIAQRCLPASVNSDIGMVVVPPARTNANAQHLGGSNSTIGDVSRPGWACSACTYVNPAGADVCEVCMRRRPRACTAKAALFATLLPGDDVGTHEPHIGVQLGWQCQEPIKRIRQMTAPERHQYYNSLA